MSSPRCSCSATDRRGAAAVAVAEPDGYWDDDDYVDDDDYIEFTVHHDHPASVAAAPVVRTEEDEGDTEPLAARHEHLRPLPEAQTSPLRRDRPSPADRGRFLTGPSTRRPTEPTPALDPTPPVEPSQPPAYSRDQGRSLLDFLADVPPPKPSVEPIGFAHNGFHVDDEQRFQPLGRFQARAEPEPPHLTRKPDVLDPDYPLDFGSHAHHESPDEADYERPSRHGLTDDEPEQYPFQPNGRHSRAEPDDASRGGRHSRPGD